MTFCLTKKNKERKFKKLRKNVKEPSNSKGFIKVYYSRLFSKNIDSTISLATDCHRQDSKGY